MNSLDLEEDQRIQQTLQELCVAKYAHSYCASCASGQGCCAVSSSCDGPSEEENMRQLEDGGKRNDKGKLRRTLTIDLSNEEKLTDGEILKRLLSPLGSPLSDKPLEVILEIIEEDDDEVEEGGMTTISPRSSEVKTFKSLREKLKEVTRTSGNNKYCKRNQKGLMTWQKKQKNDSETIVCNSLKSPIYSSLSSLQIFPSFKKANSLINEIEKCFLETANLVEKTLGPLQPQVNQQMQPHPLSHHQLHQPQSRLQQNEKQSQFKTRSEIRRQFSESIQEAHGVFDSILNGNKIEIRTDSNGYCLNKESNCSREWNKYNSNVENQNCYERNLGGINNSFNNWYSKPSALHDAPNHQNFDNTFRTGFDRDVDKLFQECYELSSVEPSTSLGSCLKNLDNLYFELNKAKESIFLEMKEEYRRKSRSNASSDSVCSQTSSLDSQECLSFINELIEKKLRGKLKHEKFNLGPPLMGLEGRTHKMIAEVIPQNYVENESAPFKENGFNQEEFIGNYDTFQHIASNSDSIVNIMYPDNFKQGEVLSESNSEMSTTTNTLDSRTGKSTQEMYGLRKELPYKYSICDTSDEENNVYMSYDENLALYEDNQELQKSLLSILHSLNDIHDNFLNRRRIEMALSQRTSNFIQNHIKAEINLNDEMANKFTNFTYNSSNGKVPYTTELSFSDRQSLSNRLSDDFESIDKIIKVSDELKNLWLYETRDLKLQHRKPSRSVSFNRGMKRYQKSSRDIPSYMSISEKSLSMPNIAINADSDLCHLSTTDYSKPDRSNSFSTNFVRQMKSENGKRYEATLNFLERIMDSTDLIRDQKGSNGIFNPHPDAHLYPYNAYMKTYQ